MTDRANEKFELLDRIEARLPELDLDQHEVDWTELPDGHVALLVDGGGLDGGTGAFFACAGDDLHVVGSLAPLAPGVIGCLVIDPDGKRSLAETTPDPLAQGGQH
jgi:hypothetical protein